MPSAPRHACSNDRATQLPAASGVLLLPPGQDHPSGRLVGAQAGSARAVNHDLEPGEAFAVGKTFDQVSAGDYDAVIVPGGMAGADKLRGEAAAVRFVGFFEAGAAAAIGHGPLTLVEADALGGRTLAPSPPWAPISATPGYLDDREVVTGQGQARTSLACGAGLPG